MCEFLRASSIVLLFLSICTTVYAEVEGFGNPVNSTPLKEHFVLKRDNLRYKTNEYYHFNVEQYLQKNAPHIFAHTTSSGTALEVINHWSGFYSVNPYIIIALMELKANTITNQQTDLQHPFGTVSVNSHGFDNQVKDVAAQLNEIILYADPIDSGNGLLTENLPALSNLYAQLFPKNTKVINFVLKKIDFLYQYDEYSFNIQNYLNEHATHLASYVDPNVNVNAAEIISHWAGISSISPKILLSLMMQQSTTGKLQQVKVTKPYGTLSTEIGFNAQVKDIANQLSKMYYSSDTMRSGFLLHRYDELSKFYAVAFPQSVKGDFNGDGMADIFLRSWVTGKSVLSLMSGTHVIESSVVNTVDLNWDIVGRGDFNGDGKNDLLWRDKNTGLNWVYLMDGEKILLNQKLNTLSLDWQVKSTGDFNKDGKADILWHSGLSGEVWVYLMDGSIIKSIIYLETRSNSDWQIIETADIDGDTSTDIIWRNLNTTENSVHLMTGLGVDMSSGNIQPLRNFDYSWIIVGSGDFNRDGTDDLVLRNTTTGLNKVFFMKNAEVFREVDINVVTDQNWFIKDVADFNGDGKSDLLWRNTSTGEFWLYIMDEEKIILSQSLGHVSMSWELQGAR
ncbi:FG-GAP repeat domain-containing protein [Aliikangiella sp. IMCC44359]|uniref:FG-GAP repeat domain-containing protein n=1 Tax=Aliikangiella sp. IMCC44359 TaxID=3459125 RepID=UPI00403B1DF6